MGSLKSFLLHMAKLLGTTANALYTRQQALVDLGVLKAIPGRGPGSGTPLDGSGVAALVIALLAADTLQDTDDRVRAFCLATPKDADRCPWTGAANLQEALATVLMSEQMAADLKFVSVYRNDRAAGLGWRPFSRHNRSDFVVSAAPRSRSAISIIAGIDSDTIRKLAAILRAEMEGSK